MKKDEEEIVKDKNVNVTSNDGIELLDEVPKLTTNFNNQTIIIIFLVVALVLIGFVIFMKKDAIFNKNNNLNNQEKTPSSGVPVKDTYALAIGKDFGIQYYVINDGNLYYKIFDSTKVGNFQNYRVIDFNLVSSYDVNKDLTLYTGVSNIKRIKTYDFMDSVSYSLLLITNEGSVYKLTYVLYSDQFNLTKLNIFGNNKVDDILSLEMSSDCISSKCATYEIINQNGEKISSNVI